MALAAPERIRTLTLTVTFARSGGWGQTLSKVWGERVLDAPRERHIDELLLLNLSEDMFENPDAIEFARDLARQNPHPQPPEAFARQLDASSRHDTLGRLPSLGMPTHVIGGERDILVPIWKSKEIAELIPGAKLTVIERAPHGLNMERAQEYNELVLGFIAEHEPAAV
jgi:pimeloyl-ACP methyl ester carboxylesterase